MSGCQMTKIIQLGNEFDVSLFKEEQSMDWWSAVPGKQQRTPFLRDFQQVLFL